MSKKHVLMASSFDMNANLERRLGNFLYKINITFPHVLRIPLFVIYTSKLKTFQHKNTHSFIHECPNLGMV